MKSFCAPTRQERDEILFRCYFGFAKPYLDCCIDRAHRDFNRTLGNVNAAGAEKPLRVEASRRLSEAIWELPGLGLDQPSFDEWQSDCADHFGMRLPARAPSTTRFGTRPLAATLRPVQLDLPFPRENSRVRAAVLTLAREFAAGFIAAGRPRVVPIELEDRALALLLICAERQHAPIGEEIQAIDQCIAEVEAGPEPFGWKVLPFVLARSLLGTTAVDTSTILCRFVTHPSAAVRELVLIAGWMVRRCLDPTLLTPPLLLNVENTLGQWIESLMLCRGLYSSETEFWQMMDGYRPVDMADQFGARIALIRGETHFLESPGFLLRHEVRVQKILLQCLLDGDDQPTPGLH